MTSPNAVPGNARRVLPSWWPGVAAWALWALAMLGLVAVPVLDRLLRQAGRPDLVQFTSDVAAPALAMVSAAAVGAVLASRRPSHPVGWLLLALALSLVTTATAAQYLTWGLLVHPGALPGARLVALCYPATGFAALTLIGLLLLLTPTGSLPSARWRWCAWALVAAPVVSLLAAALAPGGWTRATGRSAAPSTCAAMAGPARRQPGGPGRRHPGRGRGGRVAGGAPSAAPGASSDCSCAGWPWPRCWWCWPG